MPMATTITDLGVLRLLQLSSSSLPVGGFSFSQGLEYAVEAGWVKNLAHTQDWLELQLLESLARVDLPIALRLQSAIQSGDQDQFQYWNQMGLACRETKELVLAETAMGDALLQLLDRLEIPLPSCAQGIEPSFVAAFVVAADHWEIGVRSTMLGLLWSWLEAQVAAAVKLVPLGQTDAQRLLGELLATASSAIDRAESLSDEEIGSALPGLAMASTRHETQYCRLFRS